MTLRRPWLRTLDSRNQWFFLDLGCPTFVIAVCCFTDRSRLCVITGSGQPDTPQTFSLASLALFQPSRNTLHSDYMHIRCTPTVFMATVVTGHNLTTKTLASTGAYNHVPTNATCQPSRLERCGAADGQALRCWA